MFNRFFVSLFVIASTFISLVSPSPVFADGEGEQVGGCRYFLGLVSWDCGIDTENLKNEAQLGNLIWTIVANVLSDLTVIAAYLILGYVIYGGYQFLFSGGEPGKVAMGRKTLTNGFIGLAIVLLASVIIGAIRAALGVTFSGNCVTSVCADPTTTVANAIQWAVGVCGIVAVIFVVYGGVLFITSSGEPSKVQRARQTILYALIGLVIVALAEVITAFVANTINSSKGSASGEFYSYPSDQISVKEIQHEKTA